jgi:hypothetical protein
LPGGLKRYVNGLRSLSWGHNGSTTSLEKLFLKIIGPVVALIELHVRTHVERLGKSTAADF